MSGTDHIDPIDHFDPDRARALDPLHFPLWGSRLIEASAGTGKTYTIAALYLRLVLGHGDEGEAHGRPLMPPEILVMTFTKAATRELSDRIRQRLQAAARCFRGEAEPDASDTLLVALLEHHADDKARQLAAWRLSVAAESMDEAAIHTIDAWCQRMLHEHAFDSGNLFDEELQVDEKRMFEEAARDYWRQKIYPLHGEALEAALAVWPSVDALIAGVQPLLAHARPEDGQGDELGDVLALAGRTRTAALMTLKDGWDRRADEMRDWIAAQLARPDCPFSKTKLKPATVNGWLDALKAWSLDGGGTMPDMTATALERLTPAGLRSICNGPGEVDIHPHFDAFASLQQALDALPDPTRVLRLHAAACVQARLDKLKRQAGTYGFKDLVDRLAAALAGPNAERLRASIVAQYPVALVDEFQDTSPTQYRIFDALYRTRDNDPRTALLLIGDPKQSIYAFRGADIDSYLAARSATMGRHYMLGTNFRSTEALVRAVNRVFQHAEEAHGRGAFMFGRAQGGGPGLLPFEPVGARGRRESLVQGGQVLPALSVVHDSQAMSRRASQARFAARCAEDIVRLLNDATAGFAAPAPAGASPEFAELRPADIAVLVRDRYEAESVRSELGRRGIASVYLSDQDSVFASEEAVDLLRWLRAVEQPLDLRLVRAALATRTVGLPLAELARMAVDDEAFERRAAEVRRLHDVWLQQGVLTMLRQTLHTFDLPARWLQQPGGERRLTNVLHLAELVQVAASHLDGETALVHWLRDQIDGEASGEDQVVRLESDADLVQVITVYKSKGLEYPLVYLPFACAYRAVAKRGRQFIALSDGQGGRRLDFKLLQESIDAADEERLKEDLRLLYVALTRARHRVWVGAGSIGSGRGLKVSTHRSALGYLLSGGDSIGADELPDRLAQAYGRCEDIELLDARGAVPDVSMLQRRQAGAALMEAPSYNARFPKDWSIGSFSAMVRHIVHVPAAQSLADMATQEELLAESVDDEFDGQPSRVVDDAAPWHRFPRGAMPGNFLHDQLEWLASEGFALNASPDLAAQLTRRCERQGWGHRAQDVVDWFAALVATPLGGAGASLEQLGERGSLLPEMEFWFPSEGLESRELDEVCRKHLVDARPRDALPRRRLQGMLMGFADLVFEHDGRYWVLDYKSNALGSGDRHYGTGALEAAMAQHRYDVQAALYLLALHRLLRQRLGDGYDPQAQLGGAIYLFMRGLKGPAAGSYVVSATPGFLDELDALVGVAMEDGA